MAERLDALSVRESNGKSYWTKIGVAFPTKDGSGWNVLLDAIPAPTDGQFKISLMVPKQRDGGGSNGPRGAADFDNDGPPF
jgi:hypothetical protein